MRDDDDLEIALLSANGNDISKSACEALFVVLVKVRRRLVQSQNSAGKAEGLGKRKTYNNTREDPLTSGAPTLHVERCVSLTHGHAIIVRPGSSCRCAFLATHDFDGVDILPHVRRAPELSYDTVDFLDFMRVVAQQCLVESYPILIEVFNSHHSRLHLNTLEASTFMNLSKMGFFEAIPNFFELLLGARHLPVILRTFLLQSQLLRFQITDQFLNVMGANDGRYFFGEDRYPLFHGFHVPP
mmetsp:Transcript_18403/g.24941  ORF Transcript_18403/g.24941 Transcript_18403/m.24941 type:complete len:242 (-) Transcript_18403:368-1093(-)